MCVFFYALLRSMKQHRLSLGAVSCFWATQGGNAFEAQVSVSPYWEKATWQYRPLAVCGVSDRHAIRFSLSAGLCRNRLGEGQ